MVKEYSDFCPVTEKVEHGAVAIVDKELAILNCGNGECQCFHGVDCPIFDQLACSED